MRSDIFEFAKERLENREQSDVTLINQSMQVSTQKVNKTLENQIRQMLIGSLCEIEDPRQMEMVLGDLLTETERVAILKRLGIAIYLDKGRSYEDIKNNLKVSSATIATVSEGLANEGFSHLIKMIKADEWAEAWTNRITKGIRKFAQK